jgi:acyl-CoA synthetase (AMP-forming)/AMP-acid ligase II
MPTALPIDAYERWMLAGRRPSVGPALTGHDVEVMRDGAPAPSGVEGEVVIRGPSVMSGYLNDPAATDQAFRDGWFHTGDLGYLLPGDGVRYLHISGRIREIAKRAGEQVSLLEVDEVLASIPGVADAGAAAFANTWVDEEIAAVVVRDSGCVLSEDDVIEHCRRALPFAAAPKRVDFVDELPRTPSGKIRRVELAERFAEYRERLFVAPPDATQAATASIDATSDGPH